MSALTTPWSDATVPARIGCVRLKPRDQGAHDAYHNIDSGRVELSVVDGDIGDGACGRSEETLQGSEAKAKKCYSGDQVRDSGKTATLENGKTYICDNGRWKEYLPLEPLAPTTAK